jgi:hypothetical protein
MEYWVVKAEKIDLIFFFLQTHHSNIPIVSEANYLVFYGMSKNSALVFPPSTSIC